MERPDINGQQIPLFDSKKYIQPHFLLPKVVEIPPHVVENKLHDDFIEQLEADEVGAKIFDFPRKLTPDETPPREAA
jgi:hypothetical protein